MDQVARMYAVNLAIKKTKEVGIYFIVIKGSPHYRAAQYYTVQMTKKLY